MEKAFSAFSDRKSLVSVVIRKCSVSNRSRDSAYEY